MPESKGSKVIHDMQYVETRYLGDSVSIDEAIALFPGQWILMKVTAFDQNRTASHGEVVAHGSNTAMCRALAKTLPSQDLAEAPFYLSSASPRSRTGTELRGALSQAAMVDGVGAWSVQRRGR